MQYWYPTVRCMLDEKQDNKNFSIEDEAMAVGDNDSCNYAIITVQWMLAWWEITVIAEACLSMQVNLRQSQTSMKVEETRNFVDCKFQQVLYLKNKNKKKHVHLSCSSKFLRIYWTVIINIEIKLIKMIDTSVN